MFARRFSNLLLIALSAVTVAGCTQLLTASSGETRRGVSSSLVQYLYPKGEVPPPVDQGIPQLNVPLRVGLAFVPGRHDSTVPGLSEADKSLLLTRVRNAFIEQKFISDIEVIPETYLQTGNGFQGLEQLARLYQVDVMALVSYDQVVTSEDTRASILYWTIIGAYVIEGSKNEVQTFVDTAIFDIKTRKMLFRAPGINKTSSRSTLIKSADELRASRRDGFSLAMSDMTTNLQSELERFRERIKQDPSVATVVEKGGGGACFGLVLFAALLRISRRRFITQRSGTGDRSQDCVHPRILDTPTLSGLMPKIVSRRRSDIRPGSIATHPPTNF